MRCSISPSPRLRIYSPWSEIHHRWRCSRSINIVVSRVFHIGFKILAYFTNFLTGAIFADSYYGTDSIFYVDESILPSWLWSLDRAHLLLLREVRVVRKSFERGRESVSAIHTRAMDVHELYGSLLGLHMDTAGRIGLTAPHMGEILKFKVTYHTEESGGDSIWLSVSDLWQDDALVLQPFQLLARTWCACRADALRNGLGRR